MGLSHALALIHPKVAAGAPGALRPRALNIAQHALFLALLASLAPTKKIRRDSGGTSSALDRPQKPFFRSTKAPGWPPETILGSKMVSRRHFFAACWRSVRSSSQVNKTLRWLAKIEVRPSHARTKKRRKFDVVAVRTRFGVPNALGLRPSVVWMASGGSPDAPRDALGATWDRPGRPESILGASQTRPGPFLDASPSVCRASPSASERSKVEFSCFLVVLGPIFLDPDELFDRFFDDPSIAEDRSTVPADSFAEATHWIFLPMRTGKLV